MRGHACLFWLKLMLAIRWPVLIEPYLMLKLSVDNLIAPDFLILAQLPE